MNAAVQTLRLDARQRAMLDEMGVKVWWPVPEAAEAPVAEAVGGPAVPVGVAPVAVVAAAAPGASARLPSQRSG